MWIILTEVLVLNVFAVMHRLPGLQAEVTRLKEANTALEVKLEAATTAVNSTRGYMSSMDAASAQLDEMQKLCAARLQSRLEGEVRVAIPCDGCKWTLCLCARLIAVLLVVPVVVAVLRRFMHWKRQLRSCAKTLLL